VSDYFRVRREFSETLRERVDLRLTELKHQKLTAAEKRLEDMENKRKLEVTFTLLKGEC